MPKSSHTSPCIQSKSSQQDSIPQALQNLFEGAGWPKEHPGAPGQGSCQGGLQPTSHGTGQLGQGQPAHAAADPAKHQTYGPVNCEYRVHAISA